VSRDLVPGHASKGQVALVPERSFAVHPNASCRGLLARPQSGHKPFRAHRAFARIHRPDAAGSSQPGL